VLRLLQELTLVLLRLFNSAALAVLAVAVPTFSSAVLVALGAVVTR
jgi:hypothetical protein